MINFCTNLAWVPGKNFSEFKKSSSLGGSILATVVDSQNQDSFAVNVVMQDIPVFAKWDNQLPAIASVGKKRSAIGILGKAKTRVSNRLSYTTSGFWIFEF
jgi:hypothetical protein